MSRVGLLFGSFDPPHVGHLELCTLVLNNCDIKEVWLVPAWQNPWKTSSFYGDRFNMCKTITGRESRINLSNIEQLIANQYEFPVYTSVVLKELSRIYSSREFYTIMTQETWAEVDKWKDGNVIKENYKFLIEGVDFPMHSFNIHSTDIRKLAHENKKLTPYVTPEVANYIMDNDIYLL